MSTQTTTVLPAGIADRPRCMAAAVIAFAADPLLRWMFPEPAAYLTFGPKVFDHYAGGAFDHGSAYRTEDFTGCAMWLPPGTGPDEEALGAVLAEAIPEQRHGEVFGLMEEVGAAHPEEPHWFLPCIAVDPIRQGRGDGTALMARHLERCDTEGAVAYLESSNPRNVPFYERLGFEVTARIQVGASPVLTAMARPDR